MDKSVERMTHTHRPAMARVLWAAALILALATQCGCARFATDRGIVREHNRRFGGETIRGAVLPFTVRLTSDSLRLQMSFAKLDSARQRARLTGQPVTVATEGKPRPGGAISGKVTVLPSGQIDFDCKVDSAAIRGEVKCPDYVVPVCPEPPPWWDRMWIGAALVLLVIAGIRFGPGLAAKFVRR